MCSTFDCDLIIQHAPLAFSLSLLAGSCSMDFGTVQYPIGLFGLKLFNFLLSSYTKCVACIVCLWACNRKPVYKERPGLVFSSYSFRLFVHCVQATSSNNQKTRPNVTLLLIFQAFVFKQISKQVNKQIMQTNIVCKDKQPHQCYSYKMPSTIFLLWQCLWHPVPS